LRLAAKYLGISIIERRKGAPLNRNMLYMVIGALAVVVVALGVYIYQQQTKPEGVELKFDDNGISIQKN
jgi:RsiW-degrading membrane proteinase PrsW (M82 family)